MSEKYILCIYVLRKKFKFMTHTNSERNKITRDHLLCITETFSGYQMVQTEYQNKLRVKFEVVDIIIDPVKYFKMKI